MKILQWETSCSMRTDRQTDMANLIVAFRNFEKVPKTSQLMLYREIIAVCSEIHTKHINTVCGQNVELYIKIQSVPRSKHTLYLGYTNQSVNAV